MNQEWIILWSIAWPLLGGVGIVAAGQRHANVRESVTLITAIGLAALVWGLMPDVLAGARPSVVLFEFMPGLALEFRVEPLGMLFAGLASLLWVVNSVYSIGYMRGNREKHQTRFYVCFAIALSAAIGVAFAANLVTLFLFYEILTISTYPLVVHKGDEKAVRSARVYLGVLLSTSIGLLLPAIIWTYGLSGTTEFAEGGILAGHIEGPLAGVLLVLFVFGVGKAAVMPVHRWLPAAMVAPTPVSALLHAVAVVKAGVFTITKIVVYIFGTDFLLHAVQSAWLPYVAAFTIITASVVALRQTNLKRLLAYSTVAQLSYVVLAAGLFQPLATMGAAIHIVAHGFGKITLFFAAGAIYTATKKTEIPQLDGIGRRMPWTMAAFSIGALSMIGLPPTAGFVSKWYIVSGSLQAGSDIAVAAIVISTVLNAAYFLPILYRAWFLPYDPDDPVMRGEAPLPVVLAVTASAMLTLAFFFYHEPAVLLAENLVASGP